MRARTVRRVLFATVAIPVALVIAAGLIVAAFLGGMAAAVYSVG